MPRVNALHALDVAFFVFHTAWMAFVCAGWIWRRTRRWHLAAVALTGLSWFLLGAWYGWGYCPCTDWHWRVRERLGHVDPPSYTQLLIREVTGLDISGAASDALTLGVYLVAAVLGILATVRDRRAGTR
jgi:hypothetical protein